ncbi:Serine/threonine-protein kinase PknB [Phycisphaerae bacterium RAS1]|nr:Serine/threonine-protein kinase PknB [Phycisphaerae bacterium RAS1]
MMPDNLSTTRELFDAAADLPADSRAAFLDRHCPDAELRAQVERLLAADSSADQHAFLPPPPPDADGALGERLGADAALGERLATDGALGERLATAGAALAHDPLIGAHIGRYHIKSLLGVGGMSRVYEAVQEQPHRVVALKVMHNRISARSALRRFQYESQVLGRLRHPNIAQIFEAGVARASLRAGSAGFQPAGAVERPSGVGEKPTRAGETLALPDASQAPGPEVPYFAMEYLPGARPLTQFAGEKQLDLRRRVELFIKLCDAVHHGHQKGVIHRDLKPANLLVEAGGEPKVIDFGVARGTDSDIALTTQQTHLGELVGTMQYMSPEQCDGDPHGIDTRSDVYSLGIVLYELLTGRPPYSVADSTIYKAARIIRDEQPVRPSAAAGLPPRLARRLRGDLDTIVLKAIEKDRDRRYASAAALADDLRRMLTGEPIAARRPTAWSRVVRWIYRRPAATMLIASTLASALIVFGGVLLDWYWSRRPYRFEISPEGQELRAVMLSGASHAVARDPNNTNGTFRFAAILAPPRATVPRRPLLVGVMAAEAGAFQRGLNIVDADGDISRPLDVLDMDENALPDMLLERENSRWQSFAPKTFGAEHVLLADVFSDPPGDEIVVAFKHVYYTQTMIAIFDFDWRQRFAVWADLDVDALAWLPSARQLVILGSNGQYFLHERGIEHVANFVHPHVVFAIKPELDVQLSEYIRQEPSERPGSHECLRPKWYWMLPTCAPAAGYELHPSQAAGGASQVEVVLTYEGSSPGVAYGVYWTLVDGTPQGETRFNEPYYLIERGKISAWGNTPVPDKDKFFLTKDLPPLCDDVIPRPPGSQSPQ